MNLEKNNNHIVIYRLARSSFKNSKMRNFFVISTIILSISLLMVMALSRSANYVTIQQQLSTSQHVIYHNVNSQQIEGLQSDDRVEDLTLMKMGAAVESEDKAYTIRSVYFSDMSKTIRTTGISEGRFPQRFNEVAVNKAFMERLNIPLVFDTPITITFLDGSVEAFVVTGFLNNEDSGNDFYLLHSKRYADEGAQLKNISYNAPARIIGADKMSAAEFKNTALMIGADYGLAQKDVNENNYFTDMLKGNPQELTFIIGLGFALIFVSILVIYSVFYISVVGQIRQFGQLRTIGMTEKQIKRMVNLEGIILCSIGIPIGIILGGVIGFALNSNGWSFINATQISFIAAVLGLFTVWISINKPAKTAATISAVEAAKYSAYTDTTKKQTRKICRSLTAFNLAKMSFRRNMKKAMLTIISISLGGILLIASFTFLVSSSIEEYARQSEFRYGEYYISFDFNMLGRASRGISELQINNPLNEEFRKKLLAVPGVTGIKSFYRTSVGIVYNDWSRWDSVIPFNREMAKEISKVINGGSLDYDKLIADDEIIILGNDLADEIFGWKFKTGDKIPLRFWDGKKEIEKEFIIAAVSDTAPDEILHGNLGFLYLPEETLEHIMGNVNLTSYLMVQGDYTDKKLSDELQSIMNERPLLSIDTLSEQIEDSRDMFNTLYNMFLGLCSFFIGFSIINMLNTLISNILARKQEFAMLQSIGMNDTQLIKTIQYEGLMLSIVSVLISLVIGSTLGYGIVKGFQSVGIDYLHYKFPIWFFLGYFVFVLVIPVIISSVTIHFFKKQSIVERLREVD